MCLLCCVSMTSVRVGKVPRRAFTDVQRDLSRTVADAPSIKLLWRGLDGDDDEVRRAPRGLSGDGPNVGKGADCYFGANGGFELPRDYSEAMVENATEVSDAIADTLLGYYAYWPHCPEDDHLLAVHVDEHEHCRWVRRDRNHTVAEIGQLPAPS